MHASASFHYSSTSAASSFVCRSRGEASGPGSVRAAGGFPRRQNTATIDTQTRSLEIESEACALIQLIQRGNRGTMEVDVNLRVEDAVEGEVNVGLNPRFKLSSTSITPTSRLLPTIAFHRHTRRNGLPQSRNHRLHRYHLWRILHHRIPHHLPDVFRQ